MKNDFGGHDNHQYNNMYAYVGMGLDVCEQLDGHEDYFYNNTVVMYQDGDYGSFACAPPGQTVLYNNSIYSPTAAVDECGTTLQQWQAQGGDPGSTANLLPSDEFILNW